MAQRPACGFGACSEFVAPSWCAGRAACSGPCRTRVQMLPRARAGLPCRPRTWGGKVAGHEDAWFARDQIAIVIETRGQVTLRHREVQGRSVLVEQVAACTLPARVIDVRTEVPVAPNEFEQIGLDRHAEKVARFRPTEPAPIGSSVRAANLGSVRSRPFFIGWGSCPSPCVFPCRVARQGCAGSGAAA
jgi:hypothetical protein